MNLKNLSFLVLIMMLLEVNFSVARENEMSQGQAKTAQFWWPNLVDLSPLRQHAKESSPMGARFNYAREFRKLNLKR